MTSSIGSIGEFMRWTKRVVTDPNAAKNRPKRWFDIDATAAAVLGSTMRRPDSSVSVERAEAD